MKNLILTLIVSFFPLLNIVAAAPGKIYVCPDCGLDCDKLTFDKPGNCPKCNMTLIEQGTQKPATTVGILLFDGAEIIDYAGPWEAFGQAGFKVFTVAEKSEPITAVFGQKVTPDYNFANSPKADIILVPGGSQGQAANNPRLIAWLQAKGKEANYVMSVCTGAFILAKAGMLDGLSATTVSGAIDRLGEVSPKTKVVRDQRYVDNGRIITTAGLSSGIDGALHLIAKVKGTGPAQLVALGMEYHWEPDSKFVRAALADQYLPAIDDMDGQLLSTEGDVDHWEVKALIAKPASAAEIADLLGKRIGQATPHARGPVNISMSKAGASGGPCAINWKFKDDQDFNWTGSGRVEPSADQPGKFLVTLKLMRGQASAQTPSTGENCSSRNYCARKSKKAIRV